MPNTPQSWTVNKMKLVVLLMCTVIHDKQTLADPSSAKLNSRDEQIVRIYNGLYQYSVSIAVFKECDSLNL